jgi:hypothetical protein
MRAIPWLTILLFCPGAGAVFAAEQKGFVSIFNGKEAP